MNISIQQMKIHVFFFKITGGSSSAATAIVSVQAATGSIHAHLLMSGLLASSNSGIIDIDNIVSNVSFPLEVKFESRDEVTGETRIIVEDLSLPNIDNVSSVTNNVSPNTLNTCKCIIFYMIQIANFALIFYLNFRYLQPLTSKLFLMHQN